MKKKFFKNILPAICDSAYLKFNLNLNLSKIDMTIRWSAKLPLLKSKELSNRRYH